MNAALPSAEHRPVVPSVRRATVRPTPWVVVVAVLAVSAVLATAPGAGEGEPDRVTVAAACCLGSGAH